MVFARYSKSTVRDEVLENILDCELKHIFSSEKMGKRKRDYDRLVVDYDSDDPYAAFGKKRKVSKKSQARGRHLSGIVI